MIAILGNRPLTDESLTTNICLVEQTLNARPTTPNDDPVDLEALALNHFILDRANVCIPFFSNAEVNSIIARCLDRVKRMRI